MNDKARVLNFDKGYLDRFAQLRIHFWEILRIADWRAMVVNTKYLDCRNDVPRFDPGAALSPTAPNSAVVKARHVQQRFKGETK
jgi:hypothetical protein